MSPAELGPSAPWATLACLERLISGITLGIEAGVARVSHPSHYLQPGASFSIAAYYSSHAHCLPL